MSKIIIQILKLFDDSGIQESRMFKGFYKKDRLEKRHDTLVDLSLFELDLNKHILLEDKKLITFVEQIVRRFYEYQTK